MRAKIAESTVRRLSLYLRFLEEFEGQGIETVSSGALAAPPPRRCARI
jgi:NADH/NAD ratio-sensing transcriptional regulator Rex